MIEAERLMSFPWAFILEGYLFVYLPTALEQPEGMRRQPFGDQRHTLEQGIMEGSRRPQVLS